MVPFRLAYTVLVVESMPMAPPSALAMRFRPMLSRGESKGAISHDAVIQNAG